MVITVYFCPREAEICTHLLTTVLSVSYSWEDAWIIGINPLVVTSCRLLYSHWLNIFHPYITAWYRNILNAKITLLNFSELWFTATGWSCSSDLGSLRLWFFDSLIPSSIEKVWPPRCHAAICVTWNVFFPSKVSSTISMLFVEKSTSIPWAKLGGRTLLVLSSKSSRHSQPG